MKKWLGIISVSLLVLIISACSDNNNDNMNDDPKNNEEAPENNNADSTTHNTTNNNEAENDVAEDITVSLKGTDGEEVAEATLTPVGDEVEVTLKGDGLPKEEAELAFHIHEKGVCEPDDFESAGGHYNPTDKSHGKESDDGKHAGDFDNIEVDENGQVDVTFTTDQISLDEDAENTLFTDDGTSFVIHEGADDYESQPAGDAGDRIACGVIADPK